MWTPFLANVSNTIKVEQRMRLLLSEIEQRYDFRQFTLESFLEWMQFEHQRSFHIVPLPMSSAQMSGGWIRTTTDDYIFVDEQALPIHQLHIILHELCHILCGHQTLPQYLNEFNQILETTRQPQEHSSHFNDATAHPLQNSGDSSEIELEAETLCDLILHQIKFRQLQIAIRQPLTCSKAMQEVYRHMDWL